MDIRRTYSGWLAAAPLILLLSLGHVSALAAAELISLEVGPEGDTYTVRLEMKLDVAADDVHQLLTNYHQLHRLHPSIVESRLLVSPGDGFSRVFTRMESCVFFFCNRFIRVEDVYQSASGDLMAVIVPGQSDFKSGTAIWRITKNGQHTVLVYEASIQPDFFIPPMIGNYLVKEKLKDELLVSFKRIECCASFRAPASERKVAAESGHIQRPRTC